MYLPETIVLVRGKQIVEVIASGGHCERWSAGIHDKENDAQREQIDHLPTVGRLGQKLGRHIAWRSNLSRVVATTVFTFQLTHESEIDDLYVVVLVQKDVLWLQVAMSEAHRV